jgi:hypothetical protein
MAYDKMRRPGTKRTLNTLGAENVFRSFHAHREPRQSTRFGPPRDISFSRSKDGTFLMRLPCYGWCVRVICCSVTQVNAYGRPPERCRRDRLSFVIKQRASSEACYGTMKKWTVIFLALVWVRSALAADTLQVTYQGKKLSLDASELAKLPATEVEASDHQTKHRYSGVLIRDILGLVGAPAGESLRGKALNLVVRITGNDNYSVVFALAEFDAGFSDRTIVLADKQDGAFLPDNAAPFSGCHPGRQPSCSPGAASKVNRGYRP